MHLNLQNQYFKSNLISYYKGHPVDILLHAFKQSFKLTPPKRLHQIRQNIFSTPLMNTTNYLSCQTKAVHQHTDYQFRDQYQAVILQTCNTYHSLHVRYIAEQISEKGKLECRQCKTDCLQMQQIVVDAVVWGFHRQINNYQNCILMVRRREVGELMKVDMLEQAETSRDKVLITQSEKAINRSTLIQLKLLQLVKDDNLYLQIESLYKQIERAKAEAQSYKQKYLDNCSVPILVNTICYYSHLRIRNPLINKLCTPSTHNQRVVVYSFQNVYCSLFESGVKKIDCRFNGCSNYFDVSNFYSNAVVVAEIQNAFYQQERQNLLGMYFMKKYVRNWQITTKSQLKHTEIGMLQSQTKEIYTQKVNFKRLKQRLEQLLTTANLLQSVSKTNKLVKKIIKTDSAITVSPLYQRMIEVSLGEHNFCPVRCIKCNNLNCLDVYSMASHFDAQRRCKLCGYSPKNKQFYQVFYIDLQLMQFIFLNGYNQSITFDLVQKSYSHKLNFFTGLSLQQKLYNENRFIEFIEPELQYSQAHIAVIDQRCIQKSIQNITEHICIFDQIHQLSNQKCSKCGLTLRVDRLLCVKSSKRSKANQRSEKRQQPSSAEYSNNIQAKNSQNKGLEQTMPLDAELKLFSIKFPKQVTKILKKKQFFIDKQKPYISFESFQTQGNLLLFNYPVRNKISESQIKELSFHTL